MDRSKLYRGQEEITLLLMTSLHTTNNWDGSGTDVFVCPMLKITAIVKEKNMHEYKCTMLRVVDGDTVDVDIDLGFVYG